MEDDVHEARGAWKKRTGEQERSEGSVCNNRQVCDRVLTRDAARNYKFCSNECELGWLRTFQNRETYNKAFYTFCSRMPYAPMPDSRRDERVAERHYTEENRRLYHAAVAERTGKN